MWWGFGEGHLPVKNPSRIRDTVVFTTVPIVSVERINTRQFNRLT
jgi:hypothetical protein